MRHEVSRLLRVPPPSLRTSIRPRDASDTQQATVVPSGHRPTTDLHARCIWWYVQPRSACTLYWVVHSFCPIPFSHFLRHVNCCQRAAENKRVPFRTFICAIFDSLRHFSRAVHVKAVARSLALAVAVVYVTCSCTLAVRSANTTFIRARTNVESRNATGDFVRDDKAP